MGIAPQGLEGWLPRAATNAEFERKLGLAKLANLPQPVNQSLPDSLEQQNIAATYVLDYLRQHARCSDPYLGASAELPPLAAAAAQIPDDLCLLALDSQRDEYCLIAASLCSPSYWGLSDKLGLPLSAIHDPVPGLNVQLAGHMQRFFAKMPAARSFVRRNVFVHAEQDLYQPQPDAADYGRLSCADLFLRSERQALVRVTPTLILFSIRVELAPLAYAQYWPEQALGLQHLLRSYSVAQQRAFGGVQKLQAVLSYLERSRG